MAAEDRRFAASVPAATTERSAVRPAPAVLRQFRPRHLAAMVVLPLAGLLASCAPMGPARTTTVASVDVNRYLGTWYEIASVKQFFSVGLVNTTANYQLNGDGSIRVENAGQYFANGGPESRIVGAARAVDDSNARLNVAFGAAPSASPPGNYWIVDLDPDYRWAIVSDPTGNSCFILSRTKTVTPELRADLLQRAADKGVNTANVTETPQF